jgi:hypothetical protein
VGICGGSGKAAALGSGNRQWQGSGEATAVKMVSDGMAAASGPADPPAPPPPMFRRASTMTTTGGGRRAWLQSGWCDNNAAVEGRQRLPMRHHKCYINITEVKHASS